VSIVSDLSRRQFLKKSSVGVVAGAAAIGGLAGMQPADARTRKDRASSSKAVAASSDPIVAYVRPGAREVTVMVGTREVVHRDPELVRRILKAAK
jgi:anaerobic selenocysteine-containing dehydrogenase